MWEQAKFWGCKRFLSKFFQTCPKSCRATFADRFLVWLPKNGLHLFFCELWAPFFEVKEHWAPFFEVKERWGPFLPRFSQILPRYLGILFGFSGILPRFWGILPTFLIYQNFWWCACTPCTPASYTTGLPLQKSMIGRICKFTNA